MSVLAVAFALRGNDGRCVEIDATGAGVSEDRCHRVLIVLAERANKDGLAWPAVASITDETGVPERSVRRALRKLEQLGHIVKVSEGLGGQSVSTKYRVLPGHLDVRVRDLLAGALPGHIDPLTRTPGRPLPGHLDGRGTPITPNRREGVVGDGAEPGVATATPPDALSQKDQAHAITWLRHLGERLGTQPRITAELVDAAATRLRAGWPADLLTTRCADDPPAKIKSASGLILSRLTDLPIEPDDLARAELDATATPAGRRKPQATVDTAELVARDDPRVLALMDRVARLPAATAKRISHEAVTNLGIPRLTSGTATVGQLDQVIALVCTAERELKGAAIGARL